MLDVVRLLAAPRADLEGTVSDTVERLRFAFVYPSDVHLEAIVEGSHDATPLHVAAGPPPHARGPMLALEHSVGATRATLRASYPAARDAFLPEEGRLLEAVADTLAAHVEQRREITRSQRLQHELQRREDVQRSLLSLHERYLLGWSSDVAGMVLEAAIAAVPTATHGSVLVRDNGGYRFAALHGYDAAALADVVLPPDQVLFGRDWRAGRAFLVDAPADTTDLSNTSFPGVEALITVNQQVRQREALVAPVVIGDTLLAAISVEHTARERCFSEADAQLLMLYAQSIGPLLQRSRAEDDAALLQQAINASSDGIAIIDIEDEGQHARVRTCNQVFADLLAVDRADTSAWRLRDVLGDAAVEQAKHAIMTALQGSGSERFDAHIPRRDGTALWLEVLVSAVPAQTRSALSVLASVRDVSERKRLTEHLQRLNSDLEQRLLEARALEAIDTAITHAQTEVDILSGVIRVVRERPDVLDANMLLRSHDGRVRHAPFATTAAGSPLALRSIADDDAALRVLAGGTVLELATGEERHPYTRAQESTPYGAYLAWPLSVQGGVSGVLELVLRPEAATDRAWRRFMHAVSTQVAVAVEHGAMIARLQHAAESYAALARFSEAIEQIDDPMALIDLGVRTLLDEFGMQRAVYVELGSDGFLHAKRRWGTASEETRAVIERAQIASSGAIGLAVTTGEAVHVADYPNWPEAVPEGVAAGMRSVLALPVRSDGAVTSAIGLSAVGQSVLLRSDQLTVARAFARRLERALERRAYERQIVRTREDAFRVLGIALEHRDYETKGHTDRVVALSRALGQRVGLDAECLEALAWGAYLHDLGKIAIADRILLKPGRLDHDEFEQVKRHTIVGYEMSRDLAFLPERTRQVVRSHHERWDGAGYPDGLSGEEIPYLARLFSLADVFDALISQRPYKPAWSVERALAELEAQAGRQFDPALCAAMVTLLRETAPAPRSDDGSGVRGGGA